MPVGKTGRQEAAKRKRRIRIHKKMARELLAKNEPLHPVVAAIVDAVATDQLEEVVVYAKEESPPKKESWWHALWA